MLATCGWQLLATWIVFATASPYHHAHLPTAEPDAWSESSPDRSDHFLPSEIELLRDDVEANVWPPAHYNDELKFVADAITTAMATTSTTETATSTGMYGNTICNFTVLGTGGTGRVTYIKEEGTDQTDQLQIIQLGNATVYVIEFPTRYQGSLIIYTDLGGYESSGSCQYGLSILCDNNPQLSQTSHWAAGDCQGICPTQIPPNAQWHSPCVSSTTVDDQTIEFLSVTSARYVAFRGMWTGNGTC